MAQPPVTIKLTPEQQALLRQAAGKNVAELAIEEATAGSCWLFTDKDKKSYLLKEADPEAYAEACRDRQPRIDPRYAHFRLKIAESPIHRIGVFTEEAIPARRTVIEYVGERVNPLEAYRRTKDASEIYTFALDKFWRIDGAIGGSGAELINHSCDPNLRWRRWRGRVLCRSTRSIRAGDELTIDYGFSPKAPKVPCRCGSPKCRGTINRVARRRSSSPKRAGAKSSRMRAS